MLARSVVGMRQSSQGGLRFALSVSLFIANRFPSGRTLQQRRRCGIQPD
jgi:hypothetical protein